VRIRQMPVPSHVECHVASVSQLQGIVPEILFGSSAEYIPVYLIHLKATCLRQVSFLTKLRTLQISFSRWSYGDWALQNVHILDILSALMQSA
jgi:hypothetical protein